MIVVTMEVYILVDSSWSMKDSKDQILHELNQYISEYPNGTRFSVYFFNQQVERPIVQKRFITLEHDMYDIWGRSAFYDAMDITIRDASYRCQIPPTIAVYTDGVDTASLHCTHAQIDELINSKKANGWKFDFLYRNPFKERRCKPFRNCSIF
jgi:hypothetical protein